MKVYLGADHRGFEAKEAVKKWLKEEGYDLIDVGAYGFDPEDDYPDYAMKVAQGIIGNDGSRGVVFCGSGHGMDMVLNKYRGVRSIIGFNEDVVVQGREHEDANALSLPTDWLDEQQAIKRTRLFLTTKFPGEMKRKRRLQKMESIGER